MPTPPPIRRQFYRVFGEMKSLSQGAQEIYGISGFQAFHCCCSLPHDSIDNLIRRTAPDGFSQC